MKIAVLFSLFALSQARHRGIFAFGASGLGSNFGQVAGFGYNNNLAVGYGSNLVRRRHGYAWQGYAPNYYGRYGGFGGFATNSPYSGQGVPIVNTATPSSPLNPGYSGNGIYGSGGLLGSPAYEDYGYGSNGYVYGNSW